MGNWGRLANAAGLNHNIVEALLADDVAQLFDQIHLQRATNATILQSHEAFLLLSDDATFLDEVGIDIHLADVVDDNRELDATLVGEYSVQKSCFSAAQITREQQYGSFFIRHLSFVIFEFT